MLWWSQLNASATNNHSVSLGYGQESNSLASSFERISWVLQVSIQNSLNWFLSLWTFISTASAVSQLFAHHNYWICCIWHQNYLNSGKFKDFPRSNLIWTVTTASSLFQGNSLINWLSQRYFKRFIIGSLLISQHSYSCPTTGVSPDELNLGQVKPNNSPLNSALSENCDTGKKKLWSFLYHFTSFVFAE